MKDNGTDTQITRAEALRLRVYRVLGHGGITKIAEDTGKHRSYLSDALHGKITSAPILDLIDAYLDEYEKAAA